MSADDRGMRAPAEPEVLCIHHKEKFKLFCQEDAEAVCLVCRDSKRHKGHTFSPIDEAALERKDELVLKLEHIQQKFRKCKDIRLIYDQTATYNQLQADHAETVIKEEFEKLHQFLRDEEASRIAALRAEEMQKCQVTDDIIAKMTKEIISLKDIIRAIEEEMGADDISFLQSYKSTAQRAQCTVLDPEPVSGALIQVAKHLGNLKFGVWEKMQSIVQYTPVILDPNSAHSRLSLSKDLTTVRFSEDNLQAPPAPERFDSSAVVLGSEGFGSGKHCWDIKVGESTDWALGVMGESAMRKGNISSRTGLWRLWYYNGEYRAGSTPEPPTLLTVRQKPQRIRVQLDWDSGELSFSDPDNGTHLHTLTHTFAEKVFPLINATCKVSPVKIMALKASVTVASLN